MSALPEYARGTPLGVALSLTEITAYDARLARGGGREWRMALDAPTSDAIAWPSLTVALRELATLAGETNGRLAIALLPPVSETRRLDVPPLDDDELELIVARNAARYFVGAHGPQIVSVANGRTRRAAGDGAVASAVPAWTVRLLYAAARESGWRVSHIVPAESAWVLAATECWPAAARDAALVLVHHRDRTDALQLRDGAITNVRRFRSVATEAAVLAESLVAPATVFALGAVGERKAWSAALAERQVQSAPPSVLPAELVGSPALLAAAYAVEATAMPFRTDETRAADRSRRNRTMWTLVGAAALLLAVAAGLAYVDVRRELAAVAAERAALKPQLAITMVGRTSVETVSGQLQALATAERQAPHWSEVIRDLTAQLPADAYLTAIRGRGDSVFFDGMATRASAVFPAVERVPSFAGVKAAAAVRRELGEGGEPMEKFTLAAKLKLSGAPREPLAPRTAAPAVPKPAAGGTP